jgi:phosphoenolpyruvate carboxykinase (GTP)
MAGSCAAGAVKRALGCAAGVPDAGVHDCFFQSVQCSGGASADPAKLPKIFYVNWFRKSPEGKFLWPGFGENSRVLEWVFARVNNEGDAVETAIGVVPGPTGISIDGLDVPAAAMAELLRVDVDEWRDELADIEAHFATFGDRLPGELRNELDALRQRLG